MKEASDEEDEFKVHVTDDIEGGEPGEPSSGEEGEIKGVWVWEGGREGGRERQREREKERERSPVGEPERARLE